jgi:hypothetical protein
LVPSKLGPARRNHHIIEQLARYYDVSVLGVGVDGDAKTFLSSFRAPVAELRLVSAQVPRGLKFFRKMVRTTLGQCDYLPARAPALRRACEDMAAGRRFDAVMLSLLLLRRLPLPNGVPVVADTHNVESDVYRRMATAADGRLRRLYAARQCRLTRDEERRCGARVDLLLATSDRDRQLFESELQIPGVEVIPNGRPRGIPASRASPGPTADSLLWFDVLLPEPAGHSLVPRSGVSRDRAALSRGAPGHRGCGAAGLVNSAP